MDIIKAKDIDGDLSPLSSISGDITRSPNIDGTITWGNGLGTKDYNKLINKPQIESVELIGDKTFEELGLSVLSASDILNILI